MFITEYVSAILCIFSVLIIITLVMCILPIIWSNLLEDKHKGVVDVVAAILMSILLLIGIAICICSLPDIF